jgi:predicted outer membrane repeat protein
MHRRSILFTLAALALGAIPFVSLAEAKQPKCLIVNLGGGGGTWDTLQAAQDDASAGDTLKVKGTCYGPTTLGKDLTIHGQSNPGFGTATLDGDQVGSVVTIGEGVSVAIDNLTITNGNAAENGGGILNEGGSVTLSDSTVSGNTAAARGGGIYNSLAGSVTITTSTVSGNTTSLNATGLGGGGIYNSQTGGSVTLTDSTVSGNTAALDGGGIRAAGGSVTLTNSAVTGNHATTGTGGGINRSGAAVVTLFASTVTGNTPDNCFGLVC